MASIILNKTETKRMLKVKDIVKDILCKRDKYGYIEYVDKDIAMCYGGLVDDVTHSTVTREPDTKSFFENRGFLVEEMELSQAWNIYISERMKKLCADR